MDANPGDERSGAGLPSEAGGVERAVRRVGASVSAAEADAAPEPLLRPGGEMGALVAATDWSATALGPTHTWPRSLRTVVDVCLESSFPMLIMWGAELTMVYNDAFRPILGDKHPRSMGQPGADCWAEIWDVVGPMLHGVLSSGTPIWAEDQLMVLDRKGHPEDCYFTFSYSPIRDESGDPGGVFVTVFETSERVIAARRMQCLRELAEARADAAATSAVAARCAAVLGRFAEEVPFACLYLVGRDGAIEEVASAGLRDAVPPAAWPLKRVIADRATVPVPTLGELPLGAEAGASPPTSALAIPVRGAAQTEVEAVLVCGLNPRRPLDEGYRSFLDLVAEDLAAGLASARAREREREQAEALAALDEAKTAFLANVSHEFRTPLTLMLGPLAEAIDAAEHEPALRERLETVRRNGDRLLRLVNSLLDFVRIDSGQAAPEPRPVDLGELTAEIAASFSEVCQLAGIDLIIECESAPAWIDVEMWETIVLNLLSNAFKFTWEGSITVSAGESEPGEIAVVVRDTGTGIAAEDLDRLSERFYRAGNARARTVEGSGIGLALVHNLVEINGGTVEISSELGAGTSVTIRLPAAAPAPAPAPAGRVPGPAPHRGRADNLYVTEARQWLGDEPDQPGTARSSARTGR